MSGLIWIQTASHSAGVPENFIESFSYSFGEERHDHKIVPDQPVIWGAVSLGTTSAQLEDSLFEIQLLES